jgi:polysaccharide deacetylase family protein (PEP-CTERM system associated)
MRAVMHAMTVDVEEHFQVSLFREHAPPARWDLYPRRAADSTRRLLEMLARRKTLATFFVLGWVAEREKALVREIAEAGHELASHGYSHAEITDLEPWQFRADIARARSAIEDAAGVRVVGYRAPSFSVVKRTLWALELLVEEGYRYDASVFPIRHDRYGIPDAPRIPHVVRTPSGSIVEVPPATARLFGQNVPVAGGGYLRQLPFGVVRWGLRQMERDGLPAVVYLHPWEIDPDQPRIRVPFSTRLRHYRNLRKTGSRLDALLGEFQFTSIARMLDAGPLRTKAAA